MMFHIESDTRKRHLTGYFIFQVIFSFLFTAIQAAAGGPENFDLVIRRTQDRFEVRARTSETPDSPEKVDFIYSLLSDNAVLEKDLSFTFYFNRRQPLSVNYFEVPCDNVSKISGNFVKGKSVSSIEKTLSEVDSPVPSKKPVKFEQKNLKASEKKTDKKFSWIKDPKLRYFWTPVLKEIAALDPEIEISEDINSTDHIKIYNVSFNSLDGVRIHGYFYYRIPAEEKKLPGMLLIHGYKNVIPAPLIDDLANVEIAILQIELRGCGRSTRNFGSPSEYILEGIESPESYIYRGAVADCLVALRVLESFNVVDKNFLITSGGSQGGGLALITAALSPKIALAIAEEPFMTDFETGMKTATEGPYVTLARWLQKNPEKKNMALRTLYYFDVVNYASSLRCPVFLSAGLKDNVCPPATIEPLFRLIESEKEIRSYPDAGHNVRAAKYLKDKYEWLRSRLEARK